MFFIRQLMYFPSGILLHKNLPIYSMVNRISFCFRNLIFFLYSCLINLKNFPLFIVCGNKFYFGHVFIRQFMHFPSGILLYKNLPIHSMVNLISFCSRNSMFLPSKSEKFPLLIVCRIWFHFGPLLRSAGKTKKKLICLPAKMYWGTRKNFLSYIVCRIRSSFTEDFVSIHGR